MSVVVNAIGYPSLVEALDTEGVLRIKPHGDGFKLEDGCDHYYFVTLSASQLRELGLELIAIADRKEQNGHSV